MPFRCVKEGLSCALGSPHAIHQTGAAMTSWIRVRISPGQRRDGIEIEWDEGLTYKDILRQHLVRHSVFSQDVVVD